jgi:hypothetical protein
MDPDLPVAVIVVGVCIILPFACKKIVDRYFENWSRRSKGLFAGILPSLIIVFLLVGWHIQATAEYAKGPQDGFMSPLLVLIYGFPLFLAYLIFSFIVANRPRTKK